MRSRMRGGELFRGQLSQELVTVLAKSGLDAASHRTSVLWIICACGWAMNARYSAASLLVLVLGRAYISAGRCTPFGRQRGCTARRWYSSWLAVNAMTRFGEQRRLLEAKPKGWGRRLARGASRHLSVCSAVPAFDRIAGLCHRHLNL